MEHLKWQCPITVWSGKEPDISYFCVLGCKAYVHMQKDKHHGKLDMKAVERTFVGYEMGSKGYRLWNLFACQIEVSRDVIYDETVYLAREDIGTRRATPDDSLFPEYPSKDSSGDELPNPVPTEADAPPPPPAPPVDPAPAPEQPQQQPPPAAPAEVPRPNHCCAHHPPADGNAPPP